MMLSSWKSKLFILLSLFCFVSQAAFASMKDAKRLASGLAEWADALPAEPPSPSGRYIWKGQEVRPSVHVEGLPGESPVRGVIGAVKDLDTAGKAKFSPGRDRAPSADTLVSPPRVKGVRREESSQVRHIRGARKATPAEPSAFRKRQNKLERALESRPHAAHLKGLRHVLSRNPDHTTLGSHLQPIIEVASQGNEYVFSKVGKWLKRSQHRRAILQEALGLERRLGLGLKVSKGKRQEQLLQFLEGERAYAKYILDDLDHARVAGQWSHTHETMGRLQQLRSRQRSYNEYFQQDIYDGKVATRADHEWFRGPKARLEGMNAIGDVIQDPRYFDINYTQNCWLCTYVVADNLINKRKRYPGPTPRHSIYARKRPELGALVSGKRTLSAEEIYATLAKDSKRRFQKMDSFQKLLLQPENSVLAIVDNTADGISHVQPAIVRHIPHNTRLEDPTIVARKALKNDGAKQKVDKVVELGDPSTGGITEVGSSAEFMHLGIAQTFNPWTKP